MIFKKKIQPPAHFRSYVERKESWDKVFEGLAFRPKTTHFPMRRKCIEAASEVAITSAYFLLAVEFFDILTEKDKRLHSLADQEQLLFECLMFASSVVCNMLNPDNEDYELYTNRRQHLGQAFGLMSLLNEDQIDEAAESRFELYDKAGGITKGESFLASSFARVLTYLSNGESFATIEARYEDTENPLYTMIAHTSIEHTRERLKAMVKVSTKRDMAEESEYGT